MTYTTPRAEIIAESFSKGVPTKGQIRFAERIAVQFEDFIAELESASTPFTRGLADDEAALWVDDIIAGLYATEWLKWYRNLTGESTDDVSKALIALTDAAHSGWNLLADDYEIFSHEELIGA
jgi:hypothetical protein